MKFLSIFSLILVFFSCRKEEVSAETLAGEWVWEQSQGGIAGMTYNTSEKDNRRIIFSAEGDYEMFQNGKSLLKSKYKIMESSSIYFEGTVPMIYLMNDQGLTFQRQAFTVKNKELMLYDEYFDGFTHRYNKRK